MVNDGRQFNELYNERGNNYIKCLEIDFIYTNDLIPNNKYYNKISIIVESILRPNRCNLNSNEINIIILNDISFPFTQTECFDQQEQILYVVKNIKSISHLNIGYIEFDEGNINYIIQLNKHTNTNTNKYIENVIKNSNICNDTSMRRIENTNNNLQNAIDKVIHEFNNNKNKINKLIILSNLKIRNENIINNSCHVYENNKQFFEVIMVNNGEEFIDNNSNEYIKCLVENNNNKIFVDSERDNNKFCNKILPQLQTQICTEPTQMPTQYPTMPPSMSFVIIYVCNWIQFGKYFLPFIANKH